MSTHKYPPIKPELIPRIEEMLEDGCPAKEVGRTVGVKGARITYWYPQYVTPPQARGEQAAMARKFNALPNSYTHERKTA